MWRRVALVRNDVSEERSTSIIRVTRIGELGSWLLLMLFVARRLFSPWWLRRYFPPKRRLLQESHGLTSKKMTSLIFGELISFACVYFIFFQIPSIFTCTQTFCRVFISYVSHYMCQPKTARQLKMGLSPAGLRTKNDCAGDDQKQFADRQTDTISLMPIINSKNGIFWDVMPCDSCKNWFFGGI
jgi:hypothetical protein